MYYIQKENYKACEDYLLNYKPAGFVLYETPEDVEKAVQSMLDSFQRHPDSSYVSCGAIMLTRDEEDYVVIYVDPAYRYREVHDYFKQPLKPKQSFELV